MDYDYKMDEQEVRDEQEIFQKRDAELLEKIRHEDPKVWKRVMKSLENPPMLRCSECGTLINGGYISSGVCGKCWEDTLTETEGG